MLVKIISKLSLAVMLLFTALFIAYFVPSAWADPLKSSNYQFTEQSLGASGLVGSQSANYQYDAATGILGLGNSASTNLQINAGNITTGDPSLAFAVNDETVDFGDFSAGAASTATATFTVLDYTSYGYIVQVFGNPPSKGGHTLAAMATATTSVPGTEQYGINLVANTSPTSLGANPDFGQFGYGQAATGYDTANNYKYVDSDIIAQGPKSSGVTTYTISYIINVNILTPGGQYSGNQTLLCTATY